MNESGCVRGREPGAELAGDLQSIHAWQINIQNDNIWLQGTGGVECFFAILTFAYNINIIFQD